MHKVALALAAFLACAAHGQRAQTTAERRQGDVASDSNLLAEVQALHGRRNARVPDPSTSAAMLLMALAPEGAFTSSMPQLHSSTSKLEWQMAGRPWPSARLMHLHMQEGTPTQPEKTMDKTPEADTAAKPYDPVAELPEVKYDLKGKTKEEQKQGAGFNQFDPLLSLSVFLSRRFGILGGLSLVGILAATEGNEIIKALAGSGAQEVNGELITTPSGLQYRDLVVTKGGDFPLPGNVVGFDVKVSIEDKVLFDSKAGATPKPVAFKFGQRPFQNVICEGVEEALSTMKPGAKRILFVPGNLGPPGVKVPDNVRLTYEVELKEVLPQYF